MRTADDRRGRLARLIDLARAYRGWSRLEIARKLDRDPGKLLPDSGNPKLDLVVGLADALDWSIGDVAEDLGVDPVDAPPDIDFPALDRLALERHRAGDWRGMAAIARQMLVIASTPIERALACNRMAGAHDGLGLYTRSLPFLQNGLAEPGLPDGLRLMLSVNLANAHYALWHLVEARRLAQLDPERAAIHAASARPDLHESMAEYEDLADTFGDDRYAALANTCRGALIEVDALLGHLPGDTAIDHLQVALDRVIDVAQHPPGDWLESWGWWCIHGCNVTLRHADGMHRDRAMAIFTNKAMEIADRLDNWSLRERAFSMEVRRREGLDESPWVLDQEEVRQLVGTMGRFPAFRDRGYRILQNARLLLGEGGTRWQAF